MWIKNFRIRKMQTLVMGIIILLCAVLMGVSASILSSLDQPFQELSEECESPPTLIYPYSYREEDVLKLADELREIPRIDKVDFLNTHYLTEEFGVDGKVMDCFSNLTEYNDRIFGKVRYVEGSRKTALDLKEGECIIPACISIEYNAKAGDVLNVVFADKTYGFTIKGIFADPYSSSTAYDSYIFVKNLPEEISMRMIPALYFSNEMTVSDIETEYQDTYGTQFPGQFHSVEDAIDGALLASRILGAILLAIAMVMLVVSCLIINFIVRNVMISDAKTIAIYKVMGYSTKDILKMYLMFYFTVASLASLVGLICSKTFSEYILQEMFENIGLVPDIKLLGIGAACYLLIVGMICLTVFFIIRRTKRVKPVYALNGMKPANTGRHKQKSGKFSGSFSPLGIALRFAVRDKRGLAGILLTSMVSVVGMNFAIVSIDVANSMKDNNDYWLGLDRSQVMITLTEGSDMRELEKLIQKDDRVEKTVPCALGPGVVNLDWEEGMDVSVMYPFVYEDYDKVEMDITEGRNPKSKDEIALAGKMADVTEKTVGDYLDVTIDGVKKSYLVTGLYLTYYNMGKNCRLTTEAYDNLGRTNIYDTLSVYLKEGVNTQAYLEDIRPQVGNLGKALPRSEQFSSIMNLIMKPQQTAIPPVTVLVLFIGGANIFCIILLKNAKEVKINGIYKCIGYSTRHLIKANIIYVSIVAILSILIAVPIILLLYPKIMMLCLSVFNLLEYDIKYQFGHIALANGIIFMVFIFCTLISSRSLRKIHVRDLVIE